MAWARVLTPAQSSCPNIFKKEVHKPVVEVMLGLDIRFPLVAKTTTIWKWHQYLGENAENSKDDINIVTCYFMPALYCYIQMAVTLVVTRM